MIPDIAYAEKEMSYLNGIFVNGSIRICRNDNPDTGQFGQNDDITFSNFGSVCEGTHMSCCCRNCNVLEMAEYQLPRNIHENVLRSDEGYTWL